MAETHQHQDKLHQHEACGLQSNQASVDANMGIPNTCRHNGVVSAEQSQNEAAASDTSTVAEQCVLNKKPAYLDRRYKARRHFRRATALAARQQIETPRHCQAKPCHQCQPITPFQMLKFRVQAWWKK